ncbi:hypothetical protein GF325_06830 [Candidatus Bathyarchaeota archaeon]|nr:hypothetical protein [Candidatus Bathyarchaeota archaeon]
MTDTHERDKRPTDNITKAINKRIYIKLKGRRHLKALLRSFDDHLNLFLDDSIEYVQRYDHDKGEHVMEENNLETIILRGDNVVFLTLDDDFEEDVTSPAE